MTLQPRQQTLCMSPIYYTAVLNGVSPLLHSVCHFQSTVTGNGVLQTCIYAMRVTPKICDTELHVPPCQLHCTKQCVVGSSIQVAKYNRAISCNSCMVKFTCGIPPAVLQRWQLSAGLQQSPCAISVCAYTRSACVYTSLQPEHAQTTLS